MTVSDVLNINLFELLVLSISIHPLGRFILLLLSYINHGHKIWLFFHIKMSWKKLLNVKVKTEFYKVMLIKQNYIKKINVCIIIHPL